MEGHVGLPTVEEMTLPPSPKRPRPDYTEVDCGKRPFHLAELLTFKKPGITQTSGSQIWLENEPIQDAELQPNNSLNNNSPKVKTSITDITEADRLILNMLYDSNKALTENSAVDASIHNSSWLGKSLKLPTALSIPRRDTEDGRHVQNTVNQSQTVTLAPFKEDVKFQADYKKALGDEGADMQSRAEEEREIQYINSLCDEKMVKNGLSFCDGKSFDTKPAESPSGSLENDSKTLELQNVGQTKEQFDEEREILCAGDCALGEIAENMKANARGNGLCGEAVEDLMAKVGCETEMSAQISGEATRGDNDVASFRVIDPAISIETDKDAKENQIAGVDLSPAVKVCNMEAHFLTHSTATRDFEQIVRYQSQEEQCRIANGCQSHIHSPSSFTDEKASDTKSCSSSSAILFSVEDESEGSQGNLGLELKVQDQSGSFFGSYNHLKAQEVECPNWELAKREIGGEIVSVEDKNGQEEGLCLTNARIQKADCNSGRELSDCDTSGFADKNYGACNVVAGNTDKEEKVVEGKMNGQEFAKSQQNNSNMADIELACDILTQDNKMVEHGKNVGEEIKPKKMVTALTQHKTNMADTFCNTMMDFNGENVVKMSELEKIVVKIEHHKANMGDSQNKACNKMETGEMGESHIVERKEAKMGQQNEKYAVVSQYGSKMSDSQYTACDAVIVEINGGKITENVEIEKLAKASPQHEENIENLLFREYIKTNSLIVGEETENESQKANVCLAETNGKLAIASPQHELNMGYFESIKTLTSPLNVVEAIENERLKANVYLAETKDHFTFPASSDAVVPGITDFGIHSQNTDHNCNGKIYPSVSLTKPGPGGFDTFEKIQLSPDDDETGHGYSPLITSLSKQLLERPQLYNFKSHPSKSKEGANEDNEIQNESCISQNALSSSDSTHNLVPVDILRPDVIAQGWPEQKSHLESTFEINKCFQDDSNLDCSSESDASKVSDRPGFEMKKQFDLVLKELRMFFDISASDVVSLPEPLRGVMEEGEERKCEEQLGSPEEQVDKETSLDDADEDVSLKICGGDGGGEQEVPLGTYEVQADPKRTELKTDPSERNMAWFPSSMNLSLMEQLSHKLMEQPRRLEPLKTCSRPIRVGLSKRAKTGSLHLPHPYK